MSARRFYEISKQAGQTDAEIAADLNDQEANEDAAIKPVGGFTAGNIASSVGGVSVTTKSPSAIGTTSATLEGTISTGGTSTTPNFQYGTSATLDTYTQTSNGSASSSATLNPSASITGLSTNTTYYYRVIGEIGSTDTLGTYYGNILSFTTGKTLRTVTVSATSTTISLGQTTSLSTTLSAGSAGTTTYEVVNGLLYCSISGSTLTADATNTGTCSIRAIDDGDSTYSAASSPTIDITIAAATSRTLSIDSGSYTSTYAFNVGTKPTITSTASAGDGSGTKTYSSSTTSVCTINSSTGLVAFVDVGTCTISAAITSAGGYSSATASSISFTITAVSRTLSLAGDSGPYAINATPPTMTATPSAGSGAITYSSSTTSVCTVNSSTGVVAFVDAGTCTIGSSIAANGGYSSASSSSRSFTITAISRTLTIDAGSFNASYAGSATPPTITSTASAGAGTKQYSSSTTSVCTINSSTGVVTFVDAGTCTIAATISSSGNYGAATATSISFTITSSPPTTSTTSSTTTTSTTTTTVASTTTTTVRATPNATSTTVAQLIVNNSRRISICHATSSATNPYVLITVDRNGLNGHDRHAGDIIPAPAGGCPGPASSSGRSASTTSVAPGKITICHATASGNYVEITIDRSGLNGHGDHLDDIIPAPADGCPYSVRQYGLKLATTTTLLAAAPGVSTSTTAVPAGKITICHATAAGFYVEITVDRSGLNGHGDHEGDIIPAPAGGCPTGVQRQAAPTTTTSLAPGKISICHATGAGFYVEITIDRNGLNGHGNHEGDIIPAPADGCPSRVQSLAISTTTSVPQGKIAICHATSGGSYELVLVNKGQLGEHGSHTQDIVPAPASGCPNPSTKISTSTTIACINARELEKLDESQSSITDGVKVDANASATDPESGTIKISTTATGPALSLVGAESIDPGVKVTVKSSGADYNKPITWVNEGYGKFCWKIEPFGDRDYIYSLPNPPAPPDARYAGLAYSTVIVKAGSLTTTDPNYQVNTLFYSPTAGTGVFADVNKNGVSDPGGQGGGTLGDKAISHVVLCVGDAAVAASGSTTSVAATSTTSPFLTTTTTINWSAGFCPEPTTTTSSPSDPTTSSSTTTSSTSTTIPGSSSTSTTTPGGTLITTTTVAGSSDPNPPIEFFVETLRVPESGYTDLVLTLTDGEKSEVVFLQLDVRNFAVIAQSLPATGQSKYLPEQKYGIALLVIGVGLMLIQLRRRSIQQ